MKKLIIILLVFIGSCTSNKITRTKQESFRCEDGQVYHYRFNKPLTWKDIHDLNIDSLKVYYLLNHAER